MRVILFILATIVVLAQDRTSAISGIVRDAQGLPIEGAVIEAIQTTTQRARRTISARDGSYLIPRLEPGIWQVTAAREGFKASRHEGVVLELDRIAVVAHRLEVGGRSETVTVTGAAQLVEAYSGSLSSLVLAPTIDNLPLNGRDYVQLATLQAGAPVARAQGRGPNTGYGLQISISGSRPFQNILRLDGVNIVSYTGATPGSVNGVNLGGDSVAEFSVIGSAFSAQYGEAAGGIINVATKSGSNQWHGGAFYFHRNDNLDARNYFDGASPPEFRRHQFGGFLGGPIRRDATFFFVNYEGLREARGETTTDTTLSLSARQGSLTSGSVFIDPKIARVLALYPLPNSSVFGDTGFYTYINRRTAKEDFVTTRIDHNLSDNGKLFLRYTLDDALRHSDTSFQAGIRADSTRHQSAVLEETQILNTRLLNTARIGFSRTVTDDGKAKSRLSAADDPALAYIPGQVLGPLTVTGLTDFPGGTNGSDYYANAINSYQFSDDMDLTHSHHSLKWGARVERSQFNTNSQNSQNGSYRFADISRFLRNVPDRFVGQLPGSDTVRGFRQWIGALYIQDSWKLASRLTMDFGMRWEATDVPTEVNGKIANLAHLTDPQTTVGDPLYRNPSLKNFSPRVGIAWDVFGNGRTLVRSGYGIYPDLILAPFLTFSGVRNPPFFNRGQVRGLAQGSFPQGGYDALRRSPTLDLVIDRLEPNIKQPQVQQWNFNVERLLGAKTSIRAAYVGSRGSNLSNVVADANLATPTTVADGRLFYPPGGKVLNPNFSQIRDRRFDAISNYHALQTWLTQRMAHGVQAQITYTFSKSLDDSSNFASSTESVNRGVLPLNGSPHFNYGRSGHDVRHYVTGQATWQIPSPISRLPRSLFGGWQLAGILTVSSGLPTTPWLGYDAARTLTHQSGINAGQRPDLVAGRNPNASTGDPNRWVDLSAFSRPAPGFQGNLGRNTINGPGLINTDASLTRRVQLRDALSLDLRFEFFNLFNHTNFDLPGLERMEVFNSTSSRPDFGLITSAGPSREIQLGLKLRF